MQFSTVDFRNWHVKQLFFFGRENQENGVTVNNLGYMQVAAVAILIFEREGKVSLHYKQGFISQEFSTPVCFIAEIRTVDTLE